MVTTINMTNLMWTCYDLLSFGVAYAPKLLSRALGMIGQHPAVKARLHADLNGVTKECESSPVPYLDAVLLETRRLIMTEDPLAMSRVARADLRIGKDIEIPQGSVVVPYDHHGKFEFQPDRFLTADGAAVKQPEWMPFASGNEKPSAFVFATQHLFTKADTGFSNIGVAKGYTCTCTKRTSHSRKIPYTGVVHGTLLKVPWKMLSEPYFEEF